MRVWQFYKQILMLLPRGDWFPFHTALCKYNLKWLVHIQFRAERITEHHWQDALQLMQHGASWLHSFFFLRTLIGHPSLSCSHQQKHYLTSQGGCCLKLCSRLLVLHFMFWPVLQIMWLWSHSAASIKKQVFKQPETSEESLFKSEGVKRIYETCSRASYLLCRETLNSVPAAVKMSNGG